MRNTFLVRKNDARKRGSHRQALHKKPIKLPQLDFLKMKKNDNDNLKTK